MRTINYTVGIDSVSPTGTQIGGQQGEHNATDICVTLTSELVTALAGCNHYRFEAEDGAGARRIIKNDDFDVAAFNSETDTLSCAIPQYVTAAGGVATVYLVFVQIASDSSDNTAVDDGGSSVEKICWSVAMRLRFESNISDNDYSDDEGIDDVQLLVEECKKIKDELESTIGFTEDINYGEKNNVYFPDDSIIDLNGHTITARTLRAKNITFRNGTIKMAGSGQTGNVLFENIHFESYDGEWKRPDYSGLTTPIESLSFINCTFDKVGIGIGSVRRLYISNCIFDRPNDPAFKQDVDMGDGSTNHTEMLKISNGSGVLESAYVAGNTFRNSVVEDAIDLYSCGEHCVITGNVFDNCWMGLEIKYQTEETNADTIKQLKGTVISNNIFINNYTNAYPIRMDCKPYDYEDYSKSPLVSFYGNIFNNENENLNTCYVFSGATPCHITGDRVINNNNPNLRYISLSRQLPENTNVPSYKKTLDENPQTEKIYYIKNESNEYVESTIEGEAFTNDITYYEKIDYEKAVYNSYVHLANCKIENAYLVSLNSSCTYDNMKHYIFAENCQFNNLIIPPNTTADIHLSNCYIHTSLCAEDANHSLVLESTKAKWHISNCNIDGIRPIRGKALITTSDLGIIDGEKWKELDTNESSSLTLVISSCMYRFCTPELISYEGSVFTNNIVNGDPFYVSYKAVSTGDVVDNCVADGKLLSSKIPNAYAMYEFLKSYAVLANTVQSLSDTRKARARENIGAVSTDELTGAINASGQTKVSVTESQSFTDTQKAQARSNIGAVSQDELSDGLDGKVDKSLVVSELTGPKQIPNGDAVYTLCNNLIKLNGVSSAVEQSLSDNQKSTARNNIGAASADVLQTGLDSKVDKSQVVSELHGNDEIPNGAAAVNLCNDMIKHNSVSSVEDQSLSEWQKSIARDNIGAASADDVSFLQLAVEHLSEISWRDIQFIVRVGKGPLYFPVGYEFTTFDSDTGADIIWVVRGHNHHAAANSELIYTMTLEMKHVYSNASGSYKSLQFDASEALYYAEDGLAVGTYHFTVANQAWYADDNGKVFQFTLTSAVPAGGQVCISMTYNATLEGKSVKTYASPSSTTVIETVTLTEGSEGTDLGTTNGAGNINHMHRIVLGSNNYAQSAARQWLNSAAAAGGVWAQTNKFDRAPSWATTYNGFMHGLPSDFLEVVESAVIPCRTNGVCECTSLDGTEFTVNQVYELADKFFLLSRPEVYGTYDSTTYKDGELLDYYDGLTNAERKKYDNGGSVRYAWLRSPNPSRANYARSVDTDGSLLNVSACHSHGVAPACIIA